MAEPRPSGKTDKAQRRWKQAVVYCARFLSLSVWGRKPPTGRIKVKIDVHAHYFPLEYIDRLERYGASHVTGLVRTMNLGFAGSSGIADHLRNMDASGVDLQILSISGQLPYFEKEAEAVDAARLANDCYARLVREFPKRFAAFACTPLPHVRAAIDETRRALDDLGMVGVTAGTV